MMKKENVLVISTGPIGWCAVTMYYAMVWIYNKVTR